MPVIFKHRIFIFLADLFFFPLPCSEFFSTLSKFVAEFIVCRDVLERQRKLEMKKAKESTLKESLTKNDATGLRRASVQAGGTSQKLAQTLLGAPLQEEPANSSPSKAIPGRRASLF